MTVPPETTSAIIVYDGDCVFCSRSMAWIAAHDAARRVSFTACTSPTGAALMREHGVDPLDPSTFLLLLNGKAYVRSEAMLRIAGVLDPVARPLVALRLVPSPIRNAIYDWTARNRRRLLPNAVCTVPSTDMISRMLP